MRVSQLFLATAALMPLAACAGDGGGAGKAPEAAVKPEAGLVVPAGPLGVARLGVNVSRAAAYGSKDGSKAMIVRRDPPPDCVCAGRNWVVRRYDVDSAPEIADQAIDDLPSARATREQTLTIIAGGSVALVSEVNRAYGVEVVFDPPLIVLPEGLPHVSVDGAKVRQELRMTVHPIGDRSRVKHKGAAVNEIRYVGDERVTTGAGAFTARKLAGAFTADLGAAQVTNATEQWFVPDIGLVRETEREKTSTLGVTIRNNASEWVLARFAPAPPVPAAAGTPAGK